MDIRNPLHIRAEDVPGFDSVQDATKWREQQKAKGHDGLIIDASHMGGQTWYVPFEHGQVLGAERARGRVTRFETAKGSKYDVTEHGTTVRDKAERSEVGHEGDKGQKPESERTIYVSREDAQKLAEFQTQGAKRSVVPVKGGRFGVRWDEGKDTGKIERRTVVTPKDEPSVGLTPVEIWNGGKEVHFGNEITRIEHEGDRPPARGLDPLHDLKIVNEHGEELSAAAEQARAVGEEAQANKEADPMFQAAVGCEARHL